MQSVHEYQIKYKARDLQMNKHLVKSSLLNLLKIPIESSETKQMFNKKMSNETRNYQ